VVSESLNLLTSDVARLLSFKTKTTYFFKTKTKTVQAKTKTNTTFSRSRPLFSKTINLLTQTTGVPRNFDWEGPKLEKICDVILVTFFGDVMVMKSLK